MIEKAVKRILGAFKKPDQSPLRKGPKGDFVFIHINKTGGTSIAQAVGLPQKRHLHVKEVIELIGEEAFSNAVVFAVVRNPWDKVVSHYKYRVKTNQTGMGDHHISFKDWVKQTYGPQKNPLYYDNPSMFATHSEWLKDEQGVIRVSHILRFENLAADYGELATKLGIKRDLPHLNAGSKGSFESYYDPETADMVKAWFQEDIERFGYSIII